MLSRVSGPNVRELTRPLWNLAENGQAANGYGAPPVVRFIWGRAWNVLGIVVAIAERLERFTQGGMPQRSWLRLRLRRVTESEARPAPAAPVTPQFEPPTLAAPSEATEEAPTVELPVDPDGNVYGAEGPISRQAAGGGITKYTRK